MANADYPVLRALVSPTPAETFLHDYWPGRWFASHGAIDRLPAALRGPELASFRALADRYRGLPTFGRGRHAPRTVTTRANPNDLYEMGLTVYLADIAHCLPEAEALLRQLERDLGVGAGCARITAFASPAGDGVSPHFDAEDVFSVQLHGAKRFAVASVTELPFPYGMQFGPRMKMFDELYLQCADGFPTIERASFETVEMKPGSVLFVPRGTWHRTEAGADSLSLSIILRPPAAAESALEAMRNLLLQDPEWRRPLYGAWGDDRQRSGALTRAQQLLADLPRVIAQLTPADLAPPPESERLAHIDRHSRFQRIPETRAEVETRGDISVYQFRAWEQERGEYPTLQLEVPPPYQPLFAWLTETPAAFAAGAAADRFPQTTFEHLQKILDTLVRARFLRLLWFRPLRN